MAKKALDNSQLRRNLGKVTQTIRAKHLTVVEEMPDWEALRETGRALKTKVLRHLDTYLLKLDPEAPGYKHFFVRPQPGGGLTSASASLRSLYGRIETAWRLEGEVLRVDVTVPTNTTATITLPTSYRMRESGLEAVAATGADNRGGQALSLGVGPGSYRFEAERQVG